MDEMSRVGGTEIFTRVVLRIKPGEIIVHAVLPGDERGAECRRNIITPAGCTFQLPEAFGSSDEHQQKLSRIAIAFQRYTHAQ